MIDIGDRIKKLRIKNELTLQELASRTELTKGFLSQLERNLTSPSLQTLEDICEALGTELSHFFKEDAEEKNDMEPILLELESHQKSMVLDPHDGQEMGYILSGKVVLVKDSTPKGIVLHKGDTFYLKGDETHFIENRSNTKAVVLWISTPPIF